jgi:hypothetical protein
MKYLTRLQEKQQVSKRCQHLFTLKTQRAKEKGRNKSLKVKTARI